MDQEEPLVALKKYEQKISKPKCPKSAIITIIILSVIIVILIAASIYVLLDKYKENEKNKQEQSEQKVPSDKTDKPEQQDEKEKEKEAQLIELYNTLAGKIFRNISYGDGGIENTFALGKQNYREEIGNVHNGQNYQKTDKNQYDIFIPSMFYITQKIRGIIFLLHGGKWSLGQKEDMEFLSKIYYRAGYVAVQMDYTLLGKGNKDANMYRMVDEIITCVQHVKNKLIKEFKMNEADLEMGILGHSAGAHLSLIYGYYIKYSSIPVKFIINIAGPVTLMPHKFIEIKEGEKPFEGIGPSDLQNIKINDYPPTSTVNHSVIFQLLYMGFQSDYDETEISSMMKGNRADENNVKYQELIGKAKYLYPVSYISDDCPPTYCFYGGRDQSVGFLQYSLLKEEAQKYPNFGPKVQLVYSKDGIHDYLYAEEDGENISVKELNYNLLLVAKTHFKQDK